MILDHFIHNVNTFSLFSHFKNFICFCQRKILAKKTSSSNLIRMASLSFILDAFHHLVSNICRKIIILHFDKFQECLMVGLAEFLGFYSGFHLSLKILVLAGLLSNTKNKKKIWGLVVNKEFYLNVKLTCGLFVSRKNDYLFRTCHSAYESNLWKHKNIQCPFLNVNVPMYNFHCLSFK